MLRYRHYYNITSERDAYFLIALVVIISVFLIYQFIRDYYFTGFKK